MEQKPTQTQDGLLKETQEPRLQSQSPEESLPKSQVSPKEADQTQIERFLKKLPPDFPFKSGQECMNFIEAVTYRYTGMPMKQTDDLDVIFVKVAAALFQLESTVLQCEAWFKKHRKQVDEISRKEQSPIIMP